MPARPKTVPAEQCAALYQNGNSIKAIARIVGVSEPTVRNKLYSVGALEFDATRNRSPITAKQCVELFNGGEGATVSEIAEQLGCTKATVVARLRSANVYTTRLRTDITEAKIREQAELGHSISATARILNTSPSLIRLYVDPDEVWPGRASIPGVRTDLRPDNVSALRTLYGITQLTAKLGCVAKTVRGRTQEAITRNLSVTLEPGFVVIHEPADDGGTRERFRMAFPDEPASSLAARLSGTFAVPRIAYALNVTTSRAAKLIREGKALGVRPVTNPLPVTRKTTPRLPRNASGNTRRDSKSGQE